MSMQLGSFSARKFADFKNFSDDEGENGEKKEKKKKNGEPEKKKKPQGQGNEPKAWERDGFWRFCHSKRSVPVHRIPRTNGPKMVKLMCDVIGNSQHSLASTGLTAAQRKALIAADKNYYVRLNKQNKTGGGINRSAEEAGENKKHNNPRRGW